MTRTAIIVCGMHRCGTSALTRILSLLGAALPKRLLPASPGNETGHWEPRDAVELNDEILRFGGTQVTALWGADGDWLASSKAKAFTIRIQELITANYGDAPLLVIKDPRISLALPLWNAALAGLGISRRIVICFRNPIEAARSLELRHTTFAPYEVWNSDRGGLLWLRYLLAAERHSRGGVRAFNDYAGLLADWRGTVQRLGVALKIDWPHSPSETEDEIDSFLNMSQRHHEARVPVASLGPVWHDWIEPVHRELQRVAEAGEPDPALFDAVAARYREALSALGGQIAALERRNADLATRLASNGHAGSVLPPARFEPVGPARLPEDPCAELQRLQADLDAQREYAGRSLNNAWVVIDRLRNECRMNQAEHARALDALTKARAEARAEIDTLTKEHAEAQAEIDALTQAEAKIRALRAENEAEMQALRHRLSGMEATRRSLDRELAMHREALEQVLSSTSWRVTAPLRALRRSRPAER